MSTQRLTLLSISITLFFSLIVGRFFYWQIFKATDLSKKSLSQLYKIEKINPERGEIYSSDNYPLVQNQTIYNLSFYKPDFKLSFSEISAKVRQTNPNLSDDSLKQMDKFSNNSDVKWITLPDAFSRTQMLALKNISGLVFQDKIQRYYPEDILGKNILGFIAHDTAGQIVGYDGLEGYYNKQLQGKTGYFWQAKDAQGKVLMSKDNWLIPAVNGRILHTSLNRSIQYISEKALKDGVEKFQADSGSISIIEPKTGDILAIAYYQSPRVASASAAANPPISKLFEPGSIFKPVVVSMALDSHSIPRSYSCEHCNQPLTIGEYSITNWNNELHPDSTIDDIIKNSDNIGMANIIKHVGLNKFLDYYQKLGLNNKTGIDLQGEARPQTKQYWPEIDLATASFGQGIAITQIQMLRAFNTIANDGILVSPRLVQTEVEGDKTIAIKSKSDTRVFSTGTTDQVKDILKYAVKNGAVAKFVPDGLEVCAKSGTAQVAVTGGYTDSQTIASYIGFSPCRDPKFTMIVTIDTPRTSPWGASTAAPIWFDVAQNISRLLQN